MIRDVGGLLPVVRSTEGRYTMTLTIAARWRVTFRVQSLARVTYPVMPAAMPKSKPKPRTPDLVAIAEANRLHEELETMRQHWQDEAALTFRRVF
jgi:hypothetical protein